MNRVDSVRPAIAKLQADAGSAALKLMDCVFSLTQLRTTSSPSARPSKEEAEAVVRTVARPSEEEAEAVARPSKEEAEARRGEYVVAGAEKEQR
jgi:hypothetical protein